jgi:hypothetical protein
MLFLKSILDQHWFKPLDFPLLFFFGGLGYCRLRVLTECAVLTSVIQLENYVSTTLSTSRRLGVLIDTLR